MATVNVRFTAVSIDVDLTSKEIAGLHVEYSTTVAGVTTANSWATVPGPELTADIWRVLGRFLGTMLSSDWGVTPDSTRADSYAVASCCCGQSGQAHPG